MENYFENHKKHNKTLFKYLGYEGKDVDYKQFAPHDTTMGFEILRWVMHKITHNPKPEKIMRVIVSMKDEETEVFIQEWFDTSRTDGYINVVSHKEKCTAKKEDSDIYEEALLQVSHKAVYNACVDYIIKTS